MAVGYGILGLRHINTCRKVPFQVNSTKFCIAFYESYLSTGPIHYIVQYLMYECQGRGTRLSLRLLISLLPPSHVSKFDRRHTGSLRKRDNLLRGKGVGERAKSYDRKKAWSSLINHSILSGSDSTVQARISRVSRSLSAFSFNPQTAN
jgi:hypothetical protein